MAAFGAVVLALLTCLAAVSLWRPLHDIPESALREGAYPAPEWLPARFRELPRTLFTSEQREALQRDGAVMLPGVIRDPAVLQILNDGSGKGAARVISWLVNGVLRSFIRDGPLGALAASALNDTAVRIFSTNIFHNAGGHPGGFTPPGPPEGGAHIDLDSTVGYVLPLLTVWLALTDAEHPLEFARGSHRANLERDCPYGPLALNDSCLAGLLAEGGGPLWWHARPGDAVVFFAQTYHWAVLQEGPRTALSARFVGVGQRMDFQDLFMIVNMPCTRRPRWCAPLGSSGLFPVVHPPESSTVDEVPWPVWPRRVDAFCDLLPNPDPRNFGKKLCPQ